MILIVGVDHIIQHLNERDRTGWQSKREEVEHFKQFLKGTVIEYDVSLIAEEFSEEAKEKSHVDKTVPEEVAMNLGIQHRLCDPDTREREILGIARRSRGLEPSEQLKQFDMRETEWFRRTQNDLGKNIIFICGEIHVDSFSKLLQSHSVNVKIVSTGWGSELNRAED